MHLTQPILVFPPGSEGHKKESKEGVSFGIFRKFTKFESKVNKLLSEKVKL